MGVIEMVKGMLGLGSGLPAFGAEIGKRANPIAGQPDVRIPYQQVVSYFGYVKPGSPPDETRDGKKFFYLYVWIPLVAPEIGVRMVSPVGKLAKPKDGDFTSPDWAEGSKDATNYFDTWICLERADGILNPADAPAKLQGAKWTQYGSNDDSSELPAQPSGKKYNSLLRVVSTPSDPLKALVRGLYRVGFTSYKPGEVQGTFLAQVGAPIKLPGTFVGRDALDVCRKAAELEAKAGEKAKEAVK